ncbi:MAG: hypothetical protein ACXVFN_00545 [Solirubrobacteraceae bacterium]
MNGGLFDVRVDRGHTTCAAARSVIRRYVAGSDRCAGSARYPQSSGWTCLSAFRGSPEVATRRRRSARVVAYAVGD